MRRLAIVAFLFFGMTTDSASAQIDDAATAKAKYESGVRHYDLSEWDPALADFKEAYRNKPDPVFLYNIAQCHRKLGHTDEAITFYQTYLRRAPDAKNREEVERRITELQSLRGAESTTGATGGKTPPPSPAVEVAPKQATAEVAATPAPAAAQPIPIPSAPAAPPAAIAVPPAAMVVPPTATPHAPAAPSEATPSPLAASASVGDYPQSPLPTAMPATPAALDFSARDQAAPEAGSPVYSRWWFWTAVGAVAAGGATVAIIMARRDPTSIPNSGLGAQKAFP